MRAVGSPVDPPPVQSQFPPGTVLQGRYKLAEPIGEGAMGTVYRGERIGLQRPVAVKFLHPAVARDPNFVKRFDVEAQAMGRLAHPNCISVIDFGVQQLPYLVMDFVPGVPLRTVLQAGPLPARRALGIIQQVLSGLEHAHAKGIVHRDVKPENILIEHTPGLAQDHVRLLDFGLAKLLDGAARLTLGMLLGTPWYMPPEQMSDAEIDQRADLYAAGIVLYEMLTGKKPFDSPSIPELLLAQKEAPPPPFHVSAPQLPISAALETVVRRALAKSPADRFQTALEMSQALDAVPELTGKPIVPTPRPPPAATILESLPWGAHVATAARGSRLSVWIARVRLGTGRARAWLHPLLRAAGEQATAIGRRTLERWRALPGRRRNTVLVAGAALGLAGLGVWLVAGGRSSPPAAPPAPRVVASKSTGAAARPTRRAPAAARAVAAPADLDRQELRRRLRERMGEHPDDARIPAALARMSFEDRRYREGLALYRQAIKRDPALRGDPGLLGHVIDGLAHDGFRSAGEEFLRGARKQARPLLVEAAREHRSPRVRQRAKALLNEGGRRPFLRWR
jgi:hypothetical protein